MGFDVGARWNGTSTSRSNGYVPPPPAGHPWAVGALLARVGIGVFGCGVRAVAAALPGGFLPQWPLVQLVGLVVATGSPSEPTEIRPKDGQHNLSLPVVLRQLQNSLGNCPTKVRVSRAWAETRTGEFVEVHMLGCGDTAMGHLLSAGAAPHGARIAHLCQCSTLQCHTVTSMPGRSVLHSGAARIRDPADLVKLWLPAHLVARAAVLGAVRPKSPNSNPVPKMMTG